MIPSHFPMDKRGVPGVSSFNIDEYAMELAGKYAPACLKSAYPFDIQDFTRTVLKCRIACLRMSADGSVLGETYFAPHVVTEYGEDGRPKRKVSVPARTILLDPGQLQHPGIARFTLAHEAGHVFLHEKYFLMAEHRARQENPEPYPNEEKDRSWLEFQANRFASSILMNRSASKILWESMQDFLDATYPHDADTANRYAEESFSEHFRVSRQAARVRLNELNLRRLPGTGDERYHPVPYRK